MIVLSKDNFYSKLADGSRSIGKHLLRFKDVCKHDFKTCSIDIANWNLSALIEVNERKRLKRAL